ncbi:hypothetical protein [Halorubrum sp. Atlit-8R]|uniref:hypothetical protein n=1 Tax=Halorubrum sp. Atlit-8R TaxID=2282126 RepID=UPI0018F46FCF|nr:hypothetical protein [Halorubrum sp. Atlit-8R]
MNKTGTRAIVAGGFVASVFVLHLREIPAEAELTAVGVLAAAAGAGIVVGYTHAQREQQELSELRNTVGRIREDQKRASQRFEVVDGDELEDDV